MLILITFMWGISYCHYLHSYTCIVASHLGTLDAPREGRDDGIEPEDGVGGPIPKMEGPLEYMPEQEMLTKRVSSNKH